MDVIRAMAHEVMVMHSGEVVEAGLVDEVLLRPQHPYTRQLVQATQGAFPHAAQQFAEVPCRRRARVVPLAGRRRAWHA